MTKETESTPIQKVSVARFARGRRRERSAQ